MQSEKFISGILRYVGNDLPQLTDRVQWVSNDIINLEGQKRNLMNKLILWNSQLSDLGKSYRYQRSTTKANGQINIIVL
jgi:hypothetical protein